MKIETQEIEYYVQEYIVNNYDIPLVTTKGHSLNLTYDSPSIYRYQPNEDEIVIQQVPGLTVEIKHDLTWNFGLKYLRTVYNTPHYSVYPYFSVYKIVNRRKLLKRLKVL